jgi:hypothetical protein
VIRHVLPASTLLYLLAACALSLPERPPVDRPGAGAEAVTPGGAPARTAHRPGVGVIESASVVSLSSSSPASGGGTASAATGVTMAYRVRMADGTTQDVVQAGERFERGERVRVTADGRVQRP